ncbi:hypothetical protein [Pararhodobacter sp.]|uniref:hypothetical protein n=1 Tax=Pararhodobacter sp. TaxID=2127056 RepID=UPI002FDE510F
MQISSVSRVRAIHRHIARLVAVDAAFMPIFERMESELMEAEAAESTDPVIQARMISKARMISEARRSRQA